MSDYQWHGISPEEFMKTYWQKKPALLKGLFKDFSDPIQPDELAGLAAEQEVESRVIAKNEEKWHVEHGPFEDYSEFGESDWTLLVQAVDHWWEEGADLVDAFRFIPNWRIDDLMVSFSTPGGGVGAHLDQYDVFIIQGQGKRHWRVGEKQPTTNKIPHPDLLQIEGFEAVIDQVLEPGDVLYIPPGCPHEGYAIENALNYSVGFRAPNQQDFISSFADHALAEECFKARYTDPDLVPRENVAAVSDTEQAAIKSLMLASLDNESEFQSWLGCYLSQAKHDLDIHQPEPHYQIEDIDAMLDEDEVLRKLGGLRCLVIGGRWFVNGEEWSISAQQIDFATYISNQQNLDVDMIKKYTKTLADKELLTKLVNHGYIYSLS
ncbi:cupin domain-containing protein [Catenovulum sp. SM1970]|uniref:cupin domain-containing protein n=1 Tax=Marinifaba aquimaris TaxID=2741323 RepID=UPI00157263CB|nr:cupin domain-containing protein [Marinifaba aquimaris]NTS78240.1 cupin domain-containing protein [Marinifaba aquimaris]